MDWGDGGLLAFLLAIGALIGRLLWALFKWVVKTKTVKERLSKATASAFKTFLAPSTTDPLNAEVGTLKDVVTTLKDTVDTQGVRIDSLEEENRALRTELDTARKHENDAWQKVTELQHELWEASALSHEQMITAREQREQLQQDLKEATIVAVKAQKRVKELEDRVSELERLLGEEA